jgi:glutaminyl-tRNA synthetase
MRMDDTNPSKEDEEYVKSILEDVRWIQRGVAGAGKMGGGGGGGGGWERTTTTDMGGEGGGGVAVAGKGEDDAGPWYGRVRKTSDYFPLIYDAAAYLIECGEAYVDELTSEEMREYRGTLTEPGRESPHRDRPISENAELFANMRAGMYPDGRYTLRAKIDVSSPNLNMRDPVLYRIKHETHQATGDDWCVYPMYDFSHPISDAVEGITHSLCTLEFEDHRPLYDWVAERMVRGGLVNCIPRQIEFSRLNLK